MYSDAGDDEYGELKKKLFQLNSTNTKKQDSFHEDQPRKATQRFKETMASLKTHGNVSKTQAVKGNSKINSNNNQSKQTRAKASLKSSSASQKQVSETHTCDVLRLLVLKYYNLLLILMSR